MKKDLVVTMKIKIYYSDLTVEELAKLLPLVAPESDYDGSIEIVPERHFDFDGYSEPIDRYCISRSNEYFCVERHGDLTDFLKKMLCDPCNDDDAFLDLVRRHYEEKEKSDKDC